MAIHNKFVDIIVVDDESDICEMVSGILEDDGHSVRCANCYIERLLILNEISIVYIY